MARTFKLESRSAAGGIDWSAELNKEQLAVVTAPGGPMLVVAGAGSGKTRALTYRLAWLVCHGADPSRIMLVTFTNRAAREMLSRVELLVKQQTKDLWGGTFHHIANRLLRQYGSALGIQPDFTILDREDAKDLLATCVHEAGVDTHTRRFPQKSVLAAISSFIQNTLEPLETVITRRYPMFIHEATEIERVMVLYSSKKAHRQLLDYDDLLSAWLRLLTEHKDIRERLAEQFQHILVDEYQDTNAIQGAIVDLLASRHRNVTVVGDDSQSIYSFRGATFENIISFNHRYPDAIEYRLETNYRSTPEILTLANSSVACNRRRLPKELRSQRPSGLKPAIVPVQDHFVQSRFIAEYILHLLVSHYDGANLRKEDIKGLTNFAAQYNTVEAFLTDVALAGEFSGETVVTGPEEQEFVILSTIHQAKGLEWPIVFIPWLADGRFPTDLAINTQEDLEEERRVFHVAVTRAKDEVYLIVPQMYANRSRSLVMMKPSRFLTELSQDLTEPMRLEEGLPYLVSGKPPKALPDPNPGLQDDPF